MRTHGVFSIIFSIALAATSIYFFYQHSFLIGVVLLIWFILRLRYRDSNSINKLNELAITTKLEKDCNVFIELGVNIAEVLNQKIFDDLFEKLLKEKDRRPPFPVFKSEIYRDKQEWVNILIENYKKKYNNTQDFVSDNTRYVWEKVKFNIKNNILWKNEEVDFNDTVYHEIFIPYDYKEEDAGLFSHNIRYGIRIRVFIVNGILRLQVGNFDKQTTPLHLKEGALGVYQTYITITSFPLMYFFDHEIPEKYLNLSAYATESWKNLYLTTKEKPKDYTADWKKLNEEIADYNYVCRLPADEPIKDMKRFQQIIKEFDGKKTDWLKKETFENLSSVPESEEDDINYFNKYLQVFISNYSKYREKRGRYNYQDYWEERP